MRARALDLRTAWATSRGLSLVGGEGTDDCLQPGAFVSGRALAPDTVRLAVFKSRRGGRGYREASVDAFLDRVVELLVVATV